MSSLHSLQVPFCGFYESEASYIIDQAFEDAFYCDDYGNSNVPEDAYWTIDTSEARLELVQAYLEAFKAQFADDTGIALNGTYDGMESPKEYNFTTDRIFIKATSEVVQALWAESVKDDHKTLAKVIKDRHTSYDGFWSFYKNDLASWLAKPVLEYDHNELQTLLLAVLTIHVPDYEDNYNYRCYELLESWTCNGGPSNAIWGAIPKKLQEFADLQREYGQAMSYELYKLTGKAYPEGTTIEEVEASEEGIELPKPRCTQTKELSL